MKRLPNLKFYIDQNKDFELYKIFSKQREVFNIEDDLNKFFYKVYPQLRKINLANLSVRQKNRLIKNYIKEVYLKEFSKIKKGVKDAKRQWEAIKKPFFKEMSEIFKKYPWPKGKYIAYPTIWGIYPRFINDKTFLFPYRHKYKNFASFVIMHEMLHFLFYDYAAKKHSGIFKNLNTEEGIF
jgi:hypothetical protein